MRFFLPAICKRRLCGRLLLCLGLVMAGCHSNDARQEEVSGNSRYLFEEEDFAQTLEQWLPADNSRDTLPDTTVAHALRVAYAGRGFRPIWISGQGVLLRTQQLLQDLDSLVFDGLNPAVYRTDWLKMEVAKAEQISRKEALPFALQLDTACTGAYLRASRDLLLGVLQPRRTDSLWFHANDTVWQVAELLSQEKLTYISLDSFRSRFPGYAAMRHHYRRLLRLKQDNSFLTAYASAADSPVRFLRQLLPYPTQDLNDTAVISSYQQWRGLKTSGKLDSATRALLREAPDSLLQLLAINMERIRWLPQHLEARAIVVNIPAMELFFLEQQKPTLHMRTVVGKKSRQTPSLAAPMRHVVFNPSWGVPPTILRKDVKSGLNRSGSGYLAKKGLHAFTKNGKPVPASQVTSANAGNYIFRQPPGPRNALGVVKFDMPNVWDIYLHDTPHKGDFTRRDRALSSGCVRLEHPRDLAVYILNELEGKRYAASRIDSITQTRKTRYQKLEHPVMVHIVYLTAFPNSTFQDIRMLPDIYGRDEKLTKAWQEKGY